MKVVKMLKKVCLLPRIWMYSLLCVVLIPSSLVLANTFIDVQTESWMYPYVEDLVSLGVFESAPYFNPDRELTRAEMVKIVVLATTGILEDRISSSQSFPDVHSKEWYYQYIETAKVTGIAKGYGDGYFRPGQSVNRAEAISFIVRAFGIPYKGAFAYRFRDVDGDEWYAAELSSAFSAGLVVGYERGNTRLFRGEQLINRAEMAKMTSQALKNLPEPEKASVNSL